MHNQKNVGVIDYTPPVLLQQGFLDPVFLVGGSTSSKQYQTANDRGRVKYWDLNPAENNTPELNQDVPVTLVVGGQTLLDATQLGMWSPLAQFGKDKNWRVKTDIGESQTIQLIIDGTNAVLEQGVQVIASYATPQHDEWLKSFRLKHTLGLKRETFTLKFPAGQLITENIEFQLPNQNGNIVALGIDNAYTLDTNELSNQIVNFSIDGLNIVENVFASYYNFRQGRDNYLQPIFLKPGSKGIFSITPTGTSLNDIYHNITFYFDN